MVVTDRLARRDRDLAGTRRVVGLRAGLVRLLHLRVAHDELVIDRVGVLHDECDGLSGDDVDLGLVEMGVVDPDVHGAGEGRCGVVSEPPGGGGHTRAGEEQGDEDRPDPRRSQVRAAHQTAACGSGPASTDDPDAQQHDDRREPHPHRGPRCGHRRRAAARSETRGHRVRPSEPARVHGEVGRQVARGRVHGDLREPHAVGGQPRHAAVRPEVGQQRRRGGLADLLDQPALSRVTVRQLGQGKGGRSAVGQEVDVGLHHVGRVASEGQDPQRHPRVRRRDHHVDRRALTLLHALRVRTTDVEPHRHEDRAALGVELRAPRGRRAAGRTHARAPSCRRRRRRPSTP